LNKSNSIIENSENKGFTEFLELLETNYVNDREKQSKININIEDICSSIKNLELFIEIDPTNETHIKISEWVGILKDFTKILETYYQYAEGFIIRKIDVDDKIESIYLKLANFFTSIDDPAKNVYPKFDGCPCL